MRDGDTCAKKMSWCHIENHAENHAYDEGRRDWERERVRPGTGVGGRSGKAVAKQKTTMRLLHVVMGYV